jgi:hypothetical protein
MFNVPAVRVTPPVAPELSPLKVSVPPAPFIVVLPSYVLLPEKVVVPVAVTLITPAVAVPPFPIAPTFQFPAPAKVRVRLAVLTEVVKLRPPINVVVAPAAVLQVPLFPLFCTTKLKIWFVLELFVSPIPGADIMSNCFGKFVPVTAKLAML